MDRDDINGLVHSTGGLDKLADLLHNAREAGEQNILGNKAGASHGGSSFVHPEEIIDGMAGYQAPGEFDPNKFYKTPNVDVLNDIRRVHIANGVRLTNQSALPPPTDTPQMFTNIAGASSASATQALPPWRSGPVPATSSAGGDLAYVPFGGMSTSANNSAATTYQHIGPSSFSSRIVSSSVSGLGNTGGNGITGGRQNAFGQILLSLEKIIDILGDISDKIDGLSGHGQGGKSPRHPRNQSQNQSSNSPFGGILGALPAIITAAIAAMKIGGPITEGAISGFGKWASGIGQDGLKDLEKVIDDIKNARGFEDDATYTARKARQAGGMVQGLFHNAGDAIHDAGNGVGRGLQDIGLSLKGSMFRGLGFLGNVGKWGGRLGLGFSEAEDAFHMATAHDAAGRVNAGAHMGTDLMSYLAVSRGSALGGFGLGGLATGLEDFADEDYINNNPNLTPEQKAQLIAQTRHRSMNQLELNAGFSALKWGGTKGIQLLSRGASGLMSRAAGSVRSLSLAGALGDTAGILEAIGRRAGPVAGGVLGAVQVGNDLFHGNRRAAIHDAGGAAGAIAGGLAGAEGGAAVGAGIGAFFGGVGAVPGAAIGGVLGGIGGSIVGSGVGSKVTDFVGDHWKGIQSGGAGLLHAIAGLVSGAAKGAERAFNQTVHININNPVIRDVADKEDIVKLIKQQMAYLQQQHQNADTHGNGPVSTGSFGLSPLLATSFFSGV